MGSSPPSQTTGEIPRHGDRPPRRAGIPDDSTRHCRENPWKTNPPRFDDVLAPSCDKAVKPVGEWNQFRLLLQGNAREPWSTADGAEFEWADGSAGAWRKQIQKRPRLRRETQRPPSCWPSTMLGVLSNIKILGIARSIQGLSVPDGIVWLTLIPTDE